MKIQVAMYSKKIFDSNAIEMSVNARVLRVKRLSENIDFFTYYNRTLKHWFRRSEFHVVLDLVETDSIFIIFTALGKLEHFIRNPFQNCTSSLPSHILCSQCSRVFISKHTIYGWIVHCTLCCPECILTMLNQCMTEIMSLGISRLNNGEFHFFWWNAVQS